MRGTGLVPVEVGTERVRGRELGHEQVEHEDVRLLDELRSLHVFPAEHLDRIGAVRKVGDGQRLRSK